MENSGNVTLIVRHLPEALPHETLSRLFSHYGASGVRPCAGAKLRNSAFVDFSNQVLASQAHQQLNRLKFLGKVLSVEWATTFASNEKSNVEKPPDSQKRALSSLSMVVPVKGGISVPGLSANSIKDGDPIAPRLGIDYPFPPHLEYAYPPPDGNILTNIVNALIAVPRFYTQVLHLMNKMNLPAPFRAALPTPPLPPAEPAPPPPPPPVEPHLADISSDESELESSDEDDGTKKRSALSRGGKRKKAKVDPIVGPAVDKDMTHEAAGVRSVSLVPKETPTIKKKNPVLQIKIVPKSVRNDVLEFNDSNEKHIDQITGEPEAKPYATLQEIETGKLPPEEILSLPMFKNYTAGDPSPVLYIKNLAKDVTNDDFYFIFGIFFGGVQSAKSDINIKLMQEGRMRGQAFVTFPSVDLAQQALKTVNGFVFKGKPMIIQFGRNTSLVKAQ